MKQAYTLLLQVALFAFVGNAFAQQVILVNEGQSIQQAINTAANGDTVRVSAGTFDESLFINKDIAVQGAGPYKTILTGGNNGSSFAYDSKRSVLIFSTVTLEGIAITQGTRDVDQNHNTMGILLEAKGGSVIRNCRIENHITGIYVSGSVNNTIENNILEFCGNGVLLAAFKFDSDNNLIQNNLIRKNGIADENDDAGVKLISNYNGNNNIITANDIVQNTIGVNNLTTNDIDANGNWWGSDTGPNNQSSNPDGNGNAVSGFVLFETWTVEQINEALSVENPNSWKLEDARFYPNPADVEVTFEFKPCSQCSGDAPDF